MFQNLDFKSRYEVGAFLRPLGSVYYVYMLMQGDSPFYIGTSSSWKRVYGHFSQRENGKVNFLVQRKIQKMQANGETVKIRLHKQFETPEEMYAEEVRLIAFYGKKLDRAGGILANLSDGGEGRAGIGTTEKQKAATRKANTGKPKSEETLRRLSESLKKAYLGRDGTFKGRKHSEATKALMSKNNSGENHPQYGIRGAAHWHYGKKRSPEDIEKMKAGQKKENMVWSDERKELLKNYWNTQPVLICPHCQKESSFKAAMVRFHFDNCKHKKSSVVEPQNQQNILQNVI